MKSQWRTALYFAAAIIITALVSSAVTMHIYNNKRGDEVMLPASEYAELTDVMALDEVMKSIDEYYYFEAPQREQLVKSAANGMVASLNDPYSAYFTDEEYQRYLSSINGAYDGIGVLIGQPTEDGAEILDVYEDTSASEAGLLAGDFIVAVDGTGVSGLTLEEISTLIARGNGEAVKLTIKRGEESFDVDVVSGTVNIKRVEHFLYNHHTGYIRISMFSGNCAEEFREAIKDLTERRMTCLVIDLRNNPGGLLKDVVSIADTLLGECTIVTVRSNGGEEEVYTSNKKGVSVPVAIIVNENSASASEILAAAVQDNEAGIIVGMPTFGKGIVQTTRRLESNGAWLKLTTSAYYTPSGKSINGTGVTPDLEVDLPEEMKSTPIDKLDQEQDAQLWAALDYVRELAGED
ncbi:MAG: S41 family peptidase [Eubacteriales bacterium]|jgi:carboxyl-terminal processing protease|nr:S41 family peptidase [Eubacteriales bacterium]MCI6978987.1 S41 family peptidase [Clostridiales bacterium]MDY5693293.1 S41 family peptidase [Eubacteriales bacterium]HZK46151.1 S41 family peptidase [Clostridia bacterium]